MQPYFYTVEYQLIEAIGIAFEEVSKNLSTESPALS